MNHRRAKESPRASAAVGRAWRSLHRIASHHVTSRHIEFHRVRPLAISAADRVRRRRSLHHITSHHITSHHITLQCISRQIASDGSGVVLQVRTGLAAVSAAAAARRRQAARQLYARSEVM